MLMDFVISPSVRFSCIGLDSNDNNNNDLLTDPLGGSSPLNYIDYN